MSLIIWNKSENNMACAISHVVHISGHIFVTFISYFELKSEFEYRKCGEFFEFEASCTSSLYPCRCSENEQCVLAA